MYGLFEAYNIACFGGYCGSFMGILYATIDLMIENVIASPGSNMCDCVDVMKC